MNGTFYKFFEAPASGNYIDYKIDISPSRKWYLKDFSFGFANIPTGALHLLVPKKGEDYAFNSTVKLDDDVIGYFDPEEENNIVENKVEGFDEYSDPRYYNLDYNNSYELRAFPTGEYNDWLADKDFITQYPESGLMPSTTREMQKTFIVSGSSELLDEIEIITEFKGKNSKIYDQDGNFVFSYSEFKQGPFSIIGNIFEYYQNYFINQLPINDNLSRGCSDKITGFFYTNNRLEYVASVRDHLTQVKWTPETIQSDKIWLAPTGIFDEGESVWKQDGGKNLSTFNYSTSSFEDVDDINSHLSERCCKNLSALSGRSYYWKSNPGGSEDVLSDKLVIFIAFRIIDPLILDSTKPMEVLNAYQNILAVGSPGSSGGVSVFHKSHVDNIGLDLYFMHGNIFNNGDKDTWINSQEGININDDGFNIVSFTYEENRNQLESRCNFELINEADASINSSIGLDTGVDLRVGELQGIEIGEVLVYKGSMYENVNDTNRYFVEGYLAHQWNMESKLPEKHPYKHGYPVIPAKAGLEGGPLENLQTAYISSLTHF